MQKLKFAAIEEAADGTYAVTGVEIFATGKWKGKPFSVDDLDEIQENFTALASEVQPGVKLGHVDSIEGGVSAPRFGTISKVYRKGKKLLADFAKVPEAVAQIIDNGGYPRVSIELWHKFTNAAGRVYKNVLDAVALLGNEQPEVSTLADIVALYGDMTVPVTYDREERDVEEFEFEAIDGQEFFDRILKAGALAEAVEQEENERQVRELQWKAQDMVIQILRGDDEYGGLTTEQKKSKISEVLDELESEIGSLAGKLEASLNGTEPKEGKMPEPTEDLSRLKDERDEFEKKATDAEARAKAAEDEAAKLKADRRKEKATADAKALFDKLPDDAPPFIRDNLEPVMVVAMTAGEGDESLKFSRNGEEVDVVDALTAVVEAFSDLKSGVLKTVFTTPKDGEPKNESALERFGTAVNEYQTEHKVTYDAAVKAVRRAQPDLAKEVDEER